MDEQEVLLTDIELCEVLKITPRTLRTYLDPAEKKGEDIRNMKHVYVGSSRRWSKKAVMEFAEK